MDLVTTGRPQSSFCPGSLFLICFETKQERRDDVYGCLLLLLHVSEGFITDPQDDEIQLDVILVVCDWNSVLLRSSTYVRVMSVVSIMKEG